MPMFTLDNEKDRHLLFQLGLNVGFRDPQNSDELNELLSKFVPHLPSSSPIRIERMLEKLEVKESLKLLITFSKGIFSNQEIFWSRSMSITMFQVDLIEELRELPLTPDELIHMLLDDDGEKASTEDKVLEKLSIIFINCVPMRRCEMLKSSNSYRINKVFVKKFEDFFGG